MVMFEKKRFIAIGVAVIVVAFGSLTLSGCKKSEPAPQLVPASVPAPEPTLQPGTDEPAAAVIEKAFKEAGIKLDEEAKAAIEAAKAEQTVCPIMGKPIDKSIFTEYKGQKVYFCCAGCIETFKKEPEKYLSKLPQFGGK